MKLLLSLCVCALAGFSRAGNPVFSGFYADPEAVVFGNKYWIFPTFSAAYEQQTFFDAFSSPDLQIWKYHPKILSTNQVTWAKRAMWAPSVFENNGKYYFLFGANDVHEGEVGGIGIAVADQPEGPYKDLIGRPLIQDIVNDAQPIDQFVFKDTDGKFYIFYGGWGHCNMAVLNSDFTGLGRFEDGSTYREVTPQNYAEGPFLFKRNDIYYFMWSEGGWTGPDYKVAYAMSNSIFGPFNRIGTILEQDIQVGTGAGHHSVIKTPGTDRHYIVYHRRPVGDNGVNSRTICIDEMRFAVDGKILPVQMTNTGVVASFPLGNSTFF